MATIIPNTLGSLVVVILKHSHTMIKTLLTLLHGFLCQQDVTLEYSLPLQYVTVTNTVTGIEHGFKVDAYSVQPNLIQLIGQDGERLTITNKTISYQDIPH